MYMMKEDLDTHLSLSIRELVIAVDAHIWQQNRKFTNVECHMTFPTVSYSVYKIITEHLHYKICVK